MPTELYEAARVDGAGEFRVAWSIKIPAIKPALLLTTIFSVIGTFQLFNEPNLLRILAPNVIGVGYTPNLYAYNLAFINQEINYAAAIAFLLGFVIMIVSYVVQLGALRRSAVHDPATLGRSPGRRHTLPGASFTTDEPSRRQAPTGRW